MNSWKETDIDGKRPVLPERDLYTLKETAETYKTYIKTALWKKHGFLERDRYWWKETYISQKRHEYTKRDCWNIQNRFQDSPLKETYIDGKRPILMERDLYYGLMERDVYWWEETYIDGKRPEYLQNAQCYWIYTYLVNKAHINLLLSTDTRKETYKRDVYTQKRPASM